MLMINAEVAFTFNIQHSKFGVQYYFSNRFYYLEEQLYEEDIF